MALKISRSKQETDNKRLVYSVIKNWCPDLINSDAKYAGRKATLSVNADAVERHKELRLLRMQKDVDTTALDAFIDEE